MKRRDVVEKDFPGKRHFEANHVRAMRFPVDKLLRYYRELDASEPCYPCRSTFALLLSLVQSRHTLLKYKQSFTCKVWPSANRLAREVEVVLVEMGFDPDGRQDRRVTRAETPALRRMSARFF